MHLRKSWVLVGLLAAVAATASALQAAVIYKWTDQDGVVHYSDQAVPGAEKVGTTTPINRAAAVGASGQTTPGSAAPKPTGPVQLTITSPSNEQVFFNDEVASVHLDVQPPLKVTQAITWHLNGKILDQPPNAVSFTLQGLDRGAYVLAATVVDQDTGDAQTSPQVTFYFRQPSGLSPQHK